MDTIVDTMKTFLDQGRFPWAPLSPWRLLLCISFSLLPSCPPLSPLESASLCIAEVSRSMVEGGVEGQVRELWGQSYPDSGPLLVWALFVPLPLVSGWAGWACGGCAASPALCWQKGVFTLRNVTWRLLENKASKMNCFGQKSALTSRRFVLLEPFFL